MKDAFGGDLVETDAFGGVPIETDAFGGVPLEGPPTAPPKKAQLQAELAAVRRETVPLPLTMATRALSGIEQGLTLADRLQYAARDAVNFQAVEKAIGLPPERGTQAWLDYYAARDKELARQSAQLEEGQGPVAKVANELAGGTARAAAELPVQIVPGMGAAGPARAVLRSSIAGGATSAGQSFNQARAEGAGRGQAVATGGVNGLITAMTTRAFGATGVESIFRKEGVAGLRNRVAAVLREAGMEGAEEMADQFQQDLAERFATNPDKPLAESVHETLLAGAIGTLLGGGVNAAGQLAEPILRPNLQQAPQTGTMPPAAPAAPSPVAQPPVAAPTEQVPTPGATLAPEREAQLRAEGVLPPTDQPVATNPVTVGQTAKQVENETTSGVWWNGERPGANTLGSGEPVYLSRSSVTADHYSRVTREGTVGNTAGNVFRVTDPPGKVLDLRRLGKKTSLAEINRALSNAGVEYQFPSFVHWSGNIDAPEETWLPFSTRAGSPESARRAFAALREAGFSGVRLADNSSTYGDPTGDVLIYFGGEKLSAEKADESYAWSVPWADGRARAWFKTREAADTFYRKKMEDDDADGPPELTKTKPGIKFADEKTTTQPVTLAPELDRRLKAVEPKTQNERNNNPVVGMEQAQPQENTGEIVPSLRPQNKEVSEAGEVVSQRPESDQWRASSQENLFQKNAVEIQRRFETAAKSAEGASAIEMVSPGWPGLKVLITREPTDPAKWRATRFQNDVPWGHNVYASKEMAISDYTGGHKTSGPAWGSNFYVKKTVIPKGSRNEFKEFQDPEAVAEGSQSSLLPTTAKSGVVRVLPQTDSRQPAAPTQTIQADLENLQGAIDSLRQRLLENQISRSVVQQQNPGVVVGNAGSTPAAAPIQTYEKAGSKTGGPPTDVTGGGVVLSQEETTNEQRQTTEQDNQPSTASSDTQSDAGRTGPGVAATTPDVPYRFGEQDLSIGKPQTTRRKREQGDDITTRVEVSAPFETTRSENWLSVNSDHLRYEVEARGDFASRTAPKKSEKVWRVYNPKTRELLVTGLTFNEAVAFAKRTMVEANFGKPPPQQPLISQPEIKGSDISPATPAQADTKPGAMPEPPVVVGVSPIKTVRPGKLKPGFVRLWRGERAGQKGVWFSDSRETAEMHFENHKDGPATLSFIDVPEEQALDYGDAAFMSKQHPAEAGDHVLPAELASQAKPVKVFTPKPTQLQKLEASGKSPGQVERLKGKKKKVEPVVASSPERAKQMLTTASKLLTSAKLNYIIGMPRDEVRAMNLPARKMQVVQQYWDSLDAVANTPPTQLPQGPGAATKPNLPKQDAKVSRIRKAQYDKQREIGESPNDPGLSIYDSTARESDFAGVVESARTHGQGGYWDNATHDPGFAQTPEGKFALQLGQRARVKVFFFRGGKAVGVNHNSVVGIRSDQPLEQQLPVLWHEIAHAHIGHEDVQGLIDLVDPDSSQFKKYLGAYKDPGLASEELVADFIADLSQLSEPALAKAFFNAEQATTHAEQFISRLPVQTKIPQGPGAATKPNQAQEAPEFVEGTALKNAVAELERAGFNVREATKEEVQEMLPEWEEAGKTLKADPEAGRKLVQQLADPERALAKGESALLLRHKLTLLNKINDEAENSWLGDKSALGRRAEALAELTELLDVVKRRGTAWGREGRWRQALAREDYSFAAQMEQMAGELKANGSQMTPEIANQIKKHTDEITAAEKDFDQTAKDESEAIRKEEKDKAFKTAKEKAKAPRKSHESSADTLKKIEEAVDEETLDAETQGHLLEKLFQQFVAENPEIQLDALDTKMVSALKEHGLDMTPEQIDMAVSRYGVFAPLDQRAAKKRARQLRREMLLRTKLRELEGRRPLQKTGREMEAWTDEHRRLLKQINEAKRRYGVVVTDATRQLKSAQDARKTALRNQISDLQWQIDNKTKIVKNRTKMATDAEIDALTEQRDKLMEQFIAIFPKDREYVMAKRKADLEKSIAKKQKQLAEGDVLPPAKEVNRPADPVLEPLIQQRDALNKAIAAARAAKQYSRAEEMAKQLAKLEQRLAQRREVLAAGAPSPEAPARRQNRPMDPELEKVQQELDAVNAEIRKTRLESEERELARLEKRINEYDRRMREGEFLPKPKRERKPSLALTKKAVEVEAKKTEYLEWRDQEIRKRWPRSKKILHGIKQTWGLMANITASFDLSAGRQLFGALATQAPKALYAPASFYRVILTPLGRMHVSAFSEAKAQEFEQARKLRPNAVSGADAASKIEYSELNVGPHKPGEEAMYSILDTLAKVPLISKDGNPLLNIPGVPIRLFARGVHASNRAFTTALNEVRAAWLDETLALNYRDSAPTMQELEVLGNMANQLTGRGRVHELVRGPSKLLWSPKLLASRIQTLIFQPLWFKPETIPQTKRARAIIAKEYARAITAIALMVLVSRMLTDDDNEDDTLLSSDFGKVKDGNTRLDPYGGYQQVAVLGARTAMAATENSKGGIVSMGADRKSSQRGVWQMWGDFARSKLHPAARVAVNIATREDPFDSESKNDSYAEFAAKQVFGSFVPLAPREIGPLVNEHGIPTALAYELLNIYGWGVNVYDDPTASKVQTRYR